MNKYLDIAPEVAAALAEGKPVVALESTIISHGMPYPQNVETALKVEEIIRQNGAVPATIAVIGGRLKAGCTKEEIEYLGKKGLAVTKASRRDLAVLLVDMMETNRYGVYHATNEGICNWYEFAKEIFAQAGIDMEVTPISSDQYPAKATRPHNSRMNKDKLEEKGFRRLPPWQDALKRYLEIIRG